MKKYILYAVGEIFLVMVGILLALQVNNWNQNKLDRKQEVQLLQQIKADLQSNSAEIKSMRSKMEIIKASADSLLEGFRTQEEIRGVAFHTSLLHRRFFFTMATSGYSQLSGSLGSLIQNSELRNRIAQLYEGDFRDIQKRQEMLSNHIDNHLSPQSNRLFIIKQRVEFKIPDFDEFSMDFYDPKNYQELIHNSEYANTVIVQKKLYSIQIAQLTKTSEHLDSVLSLLESEMKTRSL
ncbi:DUF6090 family protein [Cryomorphaceae bacterium 1068]|nr:DUF6090 family protein [Cryomorphaceae bacterium 1068]